MITVWDKEGCSIKMLGFGHEGEEDVFYAKRRKLFISVRHGGVRDKFTIKVKGFKDVKLVRSNPRASLTLPQFVRFSKVTVEEAY